MQPLQSRWVLRPLQIGRCFADNCRVQPAADQPGSTHTAAKQAYAAGSFAHVLAGAGRSPCDATDSQLTSSSPALSSYLRLYFQCSNRYNRAYRSADGTRYTGRCPACGKTMNFAVGKGGTSKRFFNVSC